MTDVGDERGEAGLSVAVASVAAYLAFAYGAWRVGGAPDGAAQTGDASGVLARLSDVVRHVIGQAGVGDAAWAALPLRHRSVLTGQDGAGQRPAVHLALLQREHRPAEF